MDINEFTDLYKRCNLNLTKTLYEYFGLNMYYDNILNCLKPIESSTELQLTLMVDNITISHIWDYESHMIIHGWYEICEKMNLKLKLLTIL